MKYIVITGVSSGIGNSTARELLAHGYHVFGSVRQAAEAERLRQELGERFTPLVFDITDTAAVVAAAAQVAAVVGDGGLTALVNNAGISIVGPLMHEPLAELRRQCEVNVVGTLAVTQAFLPLLGARKDAPHPPGRIVTVTSTVGKVIFPFYGAYGASKHAVEGMMEALRRELVMYGIDVVVVAPGAVRTPMWDKQGKTDFSLYAGTDYAGPLAQMEEMMGRMRNAGMTPDKIAHRLRQIIQTPRPKARYGIYKNWLLAWFLPRWMPFRLVDRVVARQLGMRPK
ncbi:MAG: SDR family oxidoreductase [Anaerolineales bacterium]|nr:SDR family oxidoreductase [Anaerolineales bacterium]MCB8952663.1 SDR family oxidoreductase [Ardenticatenales bacterium]